MIGRTISHYRITEKLGQGGMGEVFLAEDANLGRKVALKFLPDVFSGDSERLARFQREAKLLASLNHANVAAIHGFEQADGKRFLVMELVEGEDLAQRVAKGPVPTNEALDICRQIAEGLEYAHERGVIHRDLKPANVKVRPDGTVKILDFGLAKALDFSDSNGSLSLGDSPTLSVAATQAGVILGTVAYMSPEQARGKPVDRRADIWSFGSVLFEIPTGKRPFEGDTISDTLAAILKSEPDWNALPTDIPPRIGELIRRCLRKDPKQRLQAIGEARIAIEESIHSAGATHELPQPAAAKPLLQPKGERRWPMRALPLATAAILLVGLAALGGWWLGDRQAIQPPRWSGDLIGASGTAYCPRLSPDGRTLAFLAMVDNLSQVAVMNPDSGNWTVLTHKRSSGVVQVIAWSPDGSRLYFDRVVDRPRGIYTVPLPAGDERLVLKDAAGPMALPDGSLLVWRTDAHRWGRICRFWPDSGRVQPLGGWIAPAPAAVARVFPDGKEAVFYGWDEGEGAEASPRLYALDTDSGKARRLAPQLLIRQTGEGFPIATTPDNRSVLIDIPSGNLHQIVAVPRSGSGSVRMLVTLTTQPWVMDAGSDGSIYVDLVERSHQILRFFASGGTPEVLATAPAHPAEVSAPLELPDGRFLLSALVSGRPRLLMGKPGGSFFPLSDTEEENRLPAALLADNQVAFIAGTGSDQTIAIASAVDGRISRRLQGCKGSYITSLAASPDGKTLYYSADSWSNRRVRIWAIPVADGTPRGIATGNGVAVDPNGKDLIVNSLDKDGTRLLRIPLSGGPAHDIPVTSDITPNMMPLGGNSLSRDGRLLIQEAVPDGWYFKMAILDIASGKVTRIPLNYEGDIMQSGWAKDGRILVLGEPFQAHIWRFRPTHSIEETKSVTAGKE